MRRFVDFDYRSGGLVAVRKSGGAARVAPGVSSFDAGGLSPSATLADKVEWLIQNMWPADAPPPKNNVDTAAAIAASTGEDISGTTVWKLRTGRQDNPQLRTLTALATFFGVPIGYFGFASEAEPIDADLTLKALMRELRAGTINSEVLRALVNLSPDARWVVDEMILAAAHADHQRDRRPGPHK